MFLLFCLTSALITITAALDIPHYDVERAEQLYEDYILTHGKTYSNQEKQIRFRIFKDKLKSINEKNSVGGAVFDINRFSDLTSKEIRQTTGIRPLNHLKDDCKIVTDKDITTKDAPKSIDWVAKGAVTPVRNQGTDPDFICFSSYAFSTIGNIESQYFIKHKKLLSLSAQEILECSEENYGCGGGVMAAAMTDIKKLGGMELESDYPFEEKLQSCRFNSSKVAIKLAGCTKYNLTDEVKLKEILAKRGPVSIAINFPMGYKKGITSEKQCSSKGELDHSALLVGYGTDNGTDYWLIKNSFGAKWGEDGYFRITRGETLVP